MVKFWNITLYEFQALRSNLAGISSQYLELIDINFFNQIDSPTHLLVVNKLKGGSL